MTGEKILKGLVTMAIIAVVMLSIWYLSNIVLYILASVVLSLIGRPLVVRLVRVKIAGRGISLTIASALTLMLMWVVFGGLLALFIPLLYGKVNTLAEMDWEGVTSVIESSLVSVQQYFERTFSVKLSGVGAEFKEFMLGLVNVDYMKTFSSIVAVIKNFGIAFFSISFITFYFMKDDGLFYRLVTLFFPDRYRKSVTNALDSITTLLSRYFGGLLVEGLVLMIIISLVLLLFGMHSSDALIIGLIIGIFNVIPYAGPVIGSFLSLCIAIISPIDGDMLHTALVLCSTIATVKIIDDFIIQPTIYSDRVQAHPLEVFLCILIAGSVAGVWGMLLAIPLYTVLRVFAREFFSEYSLVRKLTSQMTE
jgi:predicted PurR-regulated permease PerM